MADFTELKQKHRATWASGEYDQIARGIRTVADLFIGKYVPTNRAYNALPAEKAEAFRKELIELYRGYITPADGKVRWGREYIITLARRA